MKLDPMYFRKKSTDFVGKKNGIGMKQLSFFAAPITIAKFELMN